MRLTVPAKAWDHAVQAESKGSAVQAESAESRDSAVQAESAESRGSAVKAELIEGGRLSVLKSDPAENKDCFGYGLLIPD